MIQLISIVYQRLEHNKKLYSPPDENKNLATSSTPIASVYDYFEDKISKKQKALEDEQKELEAVKTEDQPKAAKKSCGCC